MIGFRGQYASDLLKNGFQPNNGGYDAGDHPPITPQNAPSSLSGKQEKLYSLVCSFFLASLSPNAIIEKTKAEFSIAGEKFTAKGVQVKSPGFKSILGGVNSLNV